MGFIRRHKKLSILAFILLVFINFGLFGTGYKLVQKKWHLWVPSYLAGREPDIPVPPGTPIDVIVMLGDHFEPYLGAPERPVAVERVREWYVRFPEMASLHRDADGNPPQHTFFYPYDELDPGLLHTLADLCYQGYGEIELHLHHLDDTEETVSLRYLDSQVQYAKVGASIFPGDPFRRGFGFIHGNWALDNSVILPDGSNRCGVNNELQVLNQTGCYADFTFPAVNSDAQPKTINQIYYATDDPERPKSYNTGVEVQVGKEPSGDLMIIHGILGFNFKDRRHGLRPSYDDGSITNLFPGDPVRVDYWVDTGVHVRGRPEWIFVKLYTHGISPYDTEANLGEAAHKMYSYLESKYNDGTQYRLHYATAREFYNIIKAAEAGKSGNPNNYRDFEIAPPLNRLLRCNTLYEPIVYQENEVELAWQDSTKVEIDFRFKHFLGLKGTLSRMNYQVDEEEGWAEWELASEKPVQIEVDLPQGFLVSNAVKEDLPSDKDSFLSARYLLTSIPVPGRATQSIRVSWKESSTLKEN